MQSIEKIIATCESTCEFLERSSQELTNWSVESRTGGWSTHQVERNVRLSMQMSQQASQLRVMVNGMKAAVV